MKRCARVNIEDASKRTDTYMRTPSTHENVCNSRHHHSRMMIRRRRAGARIVKRRKKNERTTICVDVLRAERTRRMRVFFFLETTNFAVYLKRREKKRRESRKKSWACWLTVTILTERVRVSERLTVCLCWSCQIENRGEKKETTIASTK